MPFFNSDRNKVQPVRTRSLLNWLSIVHLVLESSSHATAATSLRTTSSTVTAVTSLTEEYVSQQPQQSRGLQSLPYYSTSSNDENDAAVLGDPNYMAAIGNPLKGLFGGALWAATPHPDAVPSSLEWYNIGLDKVMMDDGENGDVLFDWTVLEGYLASSASRNMHASFSFFIHYPGSPPFRLPPLLRSKVEMRDYMDGTTAKQSPYYGDPLLLRALDKFIAAFGAKYDGDTRIAEIQLGLLGFWGEFHTYPHDFVPESAKASVITWYKNAFSQSQLSMRYPRDDSHGLGYNDASFTSNTLVGEYNGGQSDGLGWYFWEKIKSQGEQNFWRTNAMSGETRPENQKLVFKENYDGGTYQKQWYRDCVEVTHASRMLHHDAFQNIYTGVELANAREMHAYMGYSFHVSQVDVAKSSTGNTVDVAITIRQFGVAPFYHDLGVALGCEGLSTPLILPGVENLVDNGASDVFTFLNIPATRECLQSVSLSLVSSYAYEERPIKWAQGTNGLVVLNLPLPGDTEVTTEGEIESDDEESIEDDETDDQTTTEESEGGEGTPGVTTITSGDGDGDETNTDESEGGDGTTGTTTVSGSDGDGDEITTDESEGGDGTTGTTTATGVDGGDDESSTDESDSGEGATGTTTATGDDGEGASCFSGSNIVDVRGKGMIAMDELTIGDYVRTAEEKFSRVLSFSHIERDGKAEYLQISGRGLTKSLEISSHHMLFVDGSAVRARDVKVGDMIGNNEVISIQAVHRVGIYAPVTTSGDIVVSGVLASCFVALTDVPAPVQHALAHAFHAPLRFACAADFTFCENETYTAGRSNFVWAVIQLARALGRLPLLVQYAGALVAAPCFLAASIFERLTKSPILVTGITLAYTFRKRTTRKVGCEAL